MEQQHHKIINLEKEIRQAELLLQSKRGKMQKLAETVSSNVNRTIVATVSNHNLASTLLGLSVRA